MAGGVREWCDDWTDAERIYKHVRGGAGSDEVAASFRAASRAWYAPNRVLTVVGLRLVRLPPE